MKAEIFNVLASLLWAISIKYFPQITHSYPWLFYPILFLLSEIFVNYKIENSLVVLLSFILVCISDYLVGVFRPEIDNDEVGRGWRHAIFLMTLITTVIALSVNTYIRIRRGSIIQDSDMIGTSMFSNIIYIVVVAIITLVIYSLIKAAIE